MCRSWIASFLSPGLAVIAAAQAPEPDRQAPVAPHQIPRVEARIEVDGVLDEPEWDRAWTMTLDFEVQPGENTPAPVRTEVLVMYNEHHIYVGFKAYDPEPGAIRAHLTDRDQAWNDRRQERRLGGRRLRHL